MFNANGIVAPFGLTTHMTATSAVPALSPSGWRRVDVAAERPLRSR